MSTTNTATATDPIDALAASPIPFDLYREVHKGLRHALFQLTTDLGAADLTSAAARMHTVERVRAVVALLHAHHGHEDTFIQPLVVVHEPTVAAIIDAGHAEIDADLGDLEVRADKLAASDGDDAVRIGLGLYRRLALFTATYLAHMAFEEGCVMARLREAMSLEDLFAVEMELRASVAPPTMCAFIGVMVPAMNITERTAMLGGMQAGAPPEVFELFRAAAEAALSPADYDALAARIGLA